MNASRPIVPMIDGASLIAAERARQVTEESHDTLTDMRHTQEELVEGAIVYAAFDRSTTVHLWPAALGEFKPGSPIKNLKRAGALLAAEIDRRLARGETE